MIGITIEFKQRVKNGEFDKLNNPLFDEETFEIANCLVAPITEPVDRVETAALDRDSAVVRLHLPKADTRDISNSTFEYGGQVWRVIGKPVQFMNENTPTDWNRYVRGEAING